MKKLQRLAPYLIFILAVCLVLVNRLTPQDEPYDATPSPVQSAAVTAEVPPETAAQPSPATTSDPKGNTESLEEDGSYDSVQDVALYLQTYGQLPGNYITKNEAEDLGWSGGSVEQYAPGKAIGGDRFSNREGLLPKANGRTWTECDIDTLGENSRGAKRLVFSNDGLIYYTDDHYETFERIYPEE